MAKAIHSMIRVLDEARSMDFYKQAFGLELAERYFYIPEDQYHLHGLICLKPTYGLSDAPLAWQLCLHEELESSGGHQSSLDENMWIFKHTNGSIEGVITTHVDDLAVCANRAFLNKQHKILSDRFGRITQQEPPFNHCGCRYTQLPNRGGYKIDQAEFTAALKDNRDQQHQGSQQIVGTCRSDQAQINTWWVIVVDIYKT